MAQVFSRRADRAIRTALGVVVVLAVVMGLRVAGVIPPLAAAGQTPEQPRPFSHAHHAGEIGIGCAYCHTSADAGPKAGFPPVATCAGCHLSTPVPVALPPPLPWRRVALVADHVFFDHSVHTARGIGCAACHGPVDRMERTRQPWPFTMAFCLDCHRDPAPFAAAAPIHCNACHR